MARQRDTDSTMPNTKEHWFSNESIAVKIARSSNTGADNLRSLRYAHMATQPRYISIADTVRADIDAQTFPTGSYLPSEAKLAARFEVSPGTIRQALKVLVDEGTLSARRGAKKIVMRSPVKATEFQVFRSFAQWAYGQGKEPGGHVIEQQWLEASRQDIELLRIDEESKVLEVVRQRTLNGTPVMLEKTHYPEEIGRIVEQLDPDLPSVTNVLLKEYEIEFVAADHVFTVGTASKSESETLEVKPGSPLLLHRRVSRDRFGTPLERSEDKYCPGTVALSVTNTEANNSLNWKPAFGF